MSTINKIKVLFGVAVSIACCSALGNQTTKGNCSSNIEGIQKGSTVNINCYFKHGSTPQGAYLIATHPTSVQTEKLQFVKIFEDNGRSYLSVNLKNISEIPARDVTVDLMDPSSGGSYDKLKPFDLSQSKIYKLIGTRKLTISGKSTTEFPLVSVEQLLRKVHPSIDLRNYCPFDGSLSLQETPNELDALGAPQFNSSEAVHQEIQRLGIIMKVRYKTIFGETITKYITAFVLYANRSSNGNIWNPSKNKSLPLECIRF